MLVFKFLCSSRQRCEGLMNDAAPCHLISRLCNIVFNDGICLFVAANGQIRPTGLLLRSSPWTR
jgi:hypothetical protein